MTVDISNSTKGINMKYSLRRHGSLRPCAPSSWEWGTPGKEWASQPGSLREGFWQAGEPRHRPQHPWPRQGLVRQGPGGGCKEAALEKRGHHGKQPWNQGRSDPCGRWSGGRQANDGPKYGLQSRPLGLLPGVHTITSPNPESSDWAWVRRWAFAFYLLQFNLPSISIEVFFNIFLSFFFKNWKLKYWVLNTLFQTCCWTQFW